MLDYFVRKISWEEIRIFEDGSIVDENGKGCTGYVIILASASSIFKRFYDF
jgi:hypothetical protein